MQLKRPTLQQLSLTSLLALGTIVMVPTLTRSAETPTPTPVLPTMPTPMSTPLETPRPIPSPISIPSPMPIPSEAPGTPVPTEQPATKNTIVDVAVSNGSFKTLTAALQAADLVTTLQSEGPFTVFAPTDAAFEKLPKGTVERLLKPENKAELVKLLTYHVVSGKVLSSDLKSGKVETLEGSSINAFVGKIGVMINKAKVITADVPASNGVIHVVDRVLMPPTKPIAKPTYQPTDSTKPTSGQMPKSAPVPSTDK